MNKTMYPSIPFSPQALLSQAIGAADTVIPVDHIAAFPAAPNLATIGTDENAETIRYAAKTENALSGCTRAVEGIAREWQIGEVIARNFTAADYEALRENLSQLDNDKLNKVIDAVSGNFAALDEDGNLDDSGVNSGSFAPKTHSHDQYSLKAPSPTDGHFAAVDATGNVIDSGKKASDFRPSTWTPTATDVGARPDTWTPTAEEVGADPAGSAATVQTALDTHADNSGVHVTPEKQAAWDNKAYEKTYRATILAANWSAAAPYTQTVEVSGITATMSPFIDVILSDTASVATSELESYGFISQFETGSGTLKCTCLEDKPTVDLTIQIKVIQNGG